MDDMSVGDPVGDLGSGFLAAGDGVDLLSLVLAAIAYPLRLRILLRLIEGPAGYSDLISATGAERTVIARHLRHLRVARLVARRWIDHVLWYEVYDSATLEFVRAAAVYGIARTSRHPPPPEPHP